MGLAHNTKSGRVLSPLREEIKQYELGVGKALSCRPQPHQNIRSYNQYLNQVKIAGIDDISHGINVNLLRKRSYCFNMQETFYFKDYESLKNLFKQVKDWIDSNPHIDNEIKFVEYEKDQIQDLNEAKIEQAYLVVPVYTRCYCPINITLYDGTVRLARLKDYWTLYDVCQYVFDTMRGFPSEIHSGRYRDFIEAWERDEYDQEAMFMNWGSRSAKDKTGVVFRGERHLNEQKKEVLERHSIYSEQVNLVRKNRELEKELATYKHRCKKLAGILNNNYSSNWSNMTGSFIMNLTKSLDSTAKIPGLDSPLKKNNYVDIESPTAKIWKDNSSEPCSPAKRRLKNKRNDIKMSLDKNVNSIPTLKTDLGYIQTEIMLLKRKIDYTRDDKLAKKSPNKDTVVQMQQISLLGNKDEQKTIGKPTSNVKNAQKVDGKSPQKATDKTLENKELDPEVTKVWAEDVWLSKAESLKLNIKEVQDELVFYEDKLVYDIADEWSEKILEFLTRLSELREEYRKIVTSDDKEKWQIILKNMILEEANSSKDFGAFVETRFWELLG